jgi:predicted RNA-binding Zn-ribbon protein involved in translation (DUF1610 family)
VPSTVAFPCRKCGAPLERAFPGEGAAAACAQCGSAVELHANALSAGAIVGCPACGNGMLYRQKDFRQAIGCLVVLVAAVLAPFTYYASLGVAALVDLLLYKLAGEVIICYRVPCHAHVRGLPPGANLGAFDLSIHDYHRMLARREAAGESGPDDKTGPPLDAASHHR